MYRPFASIFARETLNMSAAEVGFLFSVFGLAYGIPAIPLGRLSDKVGRRPIVLVGSMLGGLSFFLFSFIDLPFQAYLLLTLAGLAFAMIDPSLSALVGDFSRVETIGKSYGILATVIQVAMAGGPIVGGIMVGLIGYRPMFALAGMFYFFAALLSLPIPRATHKEVVRHPYRDDPETSDAEKSVIGWAGIFFTFIFVGSFNVFIPLYAKALGYGEVAVGTILTSLFLAGAFARLPMGVVMDRGRLERVMVSPSLFITSALTVMMPFSGSFELFVIVGVALGFSSAVLNSSSLTLVARSSSMTERGRAMGVTTLTRSMGITVGPAVMGYVIFLVGERIEGYLFGFLALSLLGGLGALFLQLIFRRRR